MDPNDVACVIQTHNEKGEPCGIRVLVSDLNEAVRTQLERLDLYVKFAKDGVATLTVDNMHWLEYNPEGGICWGCEYGNRCGHPNYNTMKEHSPTCLVKRVVEDLHKYEPEE